MLTAAGANVIVVDNRFVKQNVVNGTTFYHCDYADPSFLARMADEKIHGIVHCAGTSLVGMSITRPSDYYNNNVVKTVQMLDHVKHWNSKPFVVFSSSAAVYGNPEVLPVTEDSTTVPINPYGNTKLMIERILHDYDIAYGLKSFCFRYFNAAGADMWGSELGPEPGDTHIIPRIFEAYQNNRPFRLFGTTYDTPDGSCVRDYIHVCDLALAHLNACQQLSGGSDSETFNLGTGTGYSNLQIIDAFREIVGNVTVHKAPQREGDPALLIADATRYNEVGVKPVFSELRTIMESFKKFYDARAAINNHVTQR